MSYVNSVTVYPSSATITKGKWYYGAYASISSNCPECAEVEWYSNSPSIASVNKTTGHIYGVSAGTTRIYAEATDGSGKKDYITVTVTAPVSVTGISVCPTSLTMNVGDTDYLCETVYPSNATNQTVTWCSSDDSVAEVNTYTGFVRAKKTGVVTITACTNDGGYSSSCTVTVEKLTKRAETEKTIFGAVVNDVIGAQAYKVSLSLTYNITKIENGKAYIEEVTAFTKYDKGNIAVGLNYPDISTGRLEIGNDTYGMQVDNRPMWISPSWVWDAKVINLNKWYNIGTTMSILSMVMLDASLFPYRDVELQTQISIT